MRRGLVLLLALAWAGAADAAPPSVSVSASRTWGPAPLAVTLTAQGNAASYLWDFGDGQKATGQAVAHTFAPGAHLVTVTAIGSTGETAQARLRVAAYVLSLAAPRRARYGRRVTFRGRLFPGRRAHVYLHRGDRPVAAVATRRSGRFRLRIRLRAPGTFQARFGDVVSRPVAPLVRPRLRASLVGFPAVGAPLRLAARVQPAAAGEIRVRVFRGRKEVLRRTYRRSLRLRLGTGRPGRYRVRLATVPRPGFASAGRTLRAQVLRLRALALGSRGLAVRLLERRLAELRYAVGRVDGHYGFDTYEAVLAFQKAQRLERTARVDARVWRALRSASTPWPRVGAGTHLEVDKARQLLLEVRGGRVVSVVHVSTGATGNTPVGRFRVYRKVVGWDGVLWYPLYFLRGFAIHGYPSVPPYPASHGCVRVPMWLAPGLFARHPYGATVYVY